MCTEDGVVYTVLGFFLGGNLNFEDGMGCSPHTSFFFLSSFIDFGKGTRSRYRNQGVDAIN